jgi:predicted dehydrogenase/threonine dehydrogenase-like Zn-dependent dehydrogenase
VRQIVQSISKGELRVVDVPQPSPAATEVLVATRRSLLSAGTERAARDLASAGLVGKAMARPDLVRQALRRARTQGVAATLTAIRSRLDGSMPLGYSAAGVAVTVGAAVDGIRPGMRVATASAGHGEYQVVPGLLAVPIPDEVDDEAAAFGAVAGVALQGLRQAGVEVGGTLAVVGLGLVGQLTTRLAVAAGLRVVGIDLRAWTAELAGTAGAVGLTEAGQETTDRILDLTRGRGADAVVIAAATRSSQPVARATRIVRDRGRLVVVGDVGLELDRRTFYERELELRFARSYGPGRYDRSYEAWGVDYPIGHVRWTAGRNIEAYLDLVARGRVAVHDLVTDVFDVEAAATAYERLTADRTVAVQLTYAAPARPARSPVALAPRPASTVHTNDLTAGLIGAGVYARATFLPALRASGWADHLVAVTSATGLSARHLAERAGIGLIVPTAEDLLARPEIAVVFILSAHDSHADLTVRALDAGKHVFVEKPLALSRDELDAVRAAHQRGAGHLFVGFNRRHSLAVAVTRRVLRGGSGPLALTYRINAEPLPASHWYHDRRQGGRILGEVCHFVDLTSWLVGANPVTVQAVAGGRGEIALREDVTVLLGYADGSAATVTYTTGGHAGTAKERLEVRGRGHTVVIDDFRRVRVDGRPVRGLRIDRGHRRQLAAVRTAILAGRPDRAGLAASFGATETTLAVVAALQHADAPARP